MTAKTSFFKMSLIALLGSLPLDGGHPDEVKDKRSSVSLERKVYQTSPSPFPFLVSDTFSEEYTNVLGFLSKPTPSFGEVQMSRGFKVIALSNMAEGLVKYGFDHPEKRGERES